MNSVMQGRCQGFLQQNTKAMSFDGFIDAIQYI